MSIKCKVCESDKKDYIEQMILQGNSDTDISKTLKDMGVDISFTSIKRHKLNHMMEYIELIKENAGEKGNKKYGRDDSQNSFTITVDILKEVENSVINGIDYNKLADANLTTLFLLNRIVNNQLAIVVNLQEKYMKGESKYPNEQLRGLQIVQEIMIKFETNSLKNFSHYKKIYDSKYGILEYIYQKGYSAKMELNKNLPYKKGTIFKIGEDDYAKLYRPKNPYSGEIGEQEYIEYEKGVDDARTGVEHQDIELYKLMFYEDYDNEIYEKGEYDVDEELIKRIKEQR